MVTTHYSKRREHSPPQRVRAAGSRQNRLLAALLVVGFIVGGLSANHTAGAAHLATGSELQAYVWANDPTADSYTPAENIQYNSTGQLNSIARTNVGAYTVSLPGMVAGGNAHVTATIGQDAAPGYVLAMCLIAGEPTSDDGATQQFVNCYDPAGAPIDTGFYLLHTSGNVYLGTHSGYVLAHDRTADSYTPDAAYQFNSTGAVNTITRHETGVYEIALPGLGLERGNIQVTSINDEGRGVSCAVRFWSVIDALKTVTVDCFDPHGEHADVPFSLLNVVGPVNSDEIAVWARGAYVRVDQPGQVGRYTPDPNSQFNSAGGAIEAESQSLGIYKVFLPGIGQPSGNFQVTAVGGGGTTAVTCSMIAWNVIGTDLIVDVLCLDPDGVLADSKFNLSYANLEQ